MRIGWSGPRPDLFADPPAARREVERQAAAVVGQGNIDGFVTGGQRGVDQWAAAWALSQGLSFEILLPWGVERFTEKWSADDRAELASLMNAASYVRIVDVDGSRGPLAFDQRNEGLVARSDKLVMIWTGLRRGGTFHTLCAAREARKPVDEIRLPGSQGVLLSGRGI